MANSVDVSFTPREIAVMAEVMARTPPPSISAAAWKEIAVKVGITDGDIGRNAKYSYAQAKKKMGIKEAAGGSTPTKSPGNKRKNIVEAEDHDGDVEGGATPSKKARKTGKGKSKERIEVKDEEDGEDEE